MSRIRQARMDRLMRSLQTEPVVTVCVADWILSLARGSRRVALLAERGRLGRPLTVSEYQRITAAHPASEEPPE